MKFRRPRLTDRRPKHMGRRRLKRVTLFRRHHRPSATLFRRRLRPPIMARLMWSRRDHIIRANHTGVVIRRITPMATAIGATATATGK